MELNFDFNRRSLCWRIDWIIICSLRQQLIYPGSSSSFSIPLFPLRRLPPPAPLLFLHTISREIACWCPAIFLLLPPRFRSPHSSQYDLYMQMLCPRYKSKFFIMICIGRIKRRREGGIYEWSRHERRHWPIAKDSGSLLICGVVVFVCQETKECLGSRVGHACVTMLRPYRIFRTVDKFTLFLSFSPPPLYLPLSPLFLFALAALFHKFSNCAYGKWNKK